jgi:acetyl-CoA carboxylase biotin carboxylase subunit
VREGSTVSVYYDPLVAKLIVWGSNRDAAISRLSSALDAFQIEGIKTSLPFHRRVVRNPVFLAGHYDTGFIEAHMSGSGG